MSHRDKGRKAARYLGLARTRSAPLLPRWVLPVSLTVLAVTCAATLPLTDLPGERNTLIVLLAMAVVGLALYVCVCRRRRKGRT